MGFLDDLFGKGTEEKVSNAVDVTMQKGKVLGKKAIAKGKVVAGAAKEKAEIAKYKVQIDVGRVGSRRF